MDRRSFLYNSILAGAGYSLLNNSCSSSRITGQSYDVPEALQLQMYDAALAIAKSKIRGGPADPVYKKPFVDAAFSPNIFYWDTCFIACYAKYHPTELPVANALDNFYDRMDEDGFISREYTREGRTMWPKEHPVSINPPLLAFAELELYGQLNDAGRLKRVYPSLQKHFRFLLEHYRMDDHLFFSDGLGSGMDNIPRYPDGWQDDGNGIKLHNLYPDIFNYDGLSPAWNKQGRSVDFSAQMALFAENLASIATIIRQEDKVADYRRIYDETKKAINEHCWNETDAFYYDLGYGKQIRRKHIGMFWTLMAGIVPGERLRGMIKHLTNPAEFWRTIPVASYPADQEGYSKEGSYWLGSVWAPTNYMVLRGLLRYNEEKTARRLAKQYYWAVAEVYKQTGTFFENYAPDAVSKGNEARPDFCGWTGLVPIAVYREFIKNH
ncbi:MAG TPA: trehalase family glycosidase [Ferruginibacter sp.]|nr:trehalase family glycosidase [Ferruginibacter sp.]